MRFARALTCCCGFASVVSDYIADVGFGALTPDCSAATRD